MLPSATVPEIQTERLLLRGWTDDDIASLTEIYSDPEVTAWLGPIDPAQTAARVDAYADHWRGHGFGQWALEELGSGGLIGRVGLVHHEDWTASPHDAEIGWALARTAWGRGYATEAARAVLDWAQARPDLKTIISITRPDNLRSRRVMEKLGLTYRGSATWHGFDQVWYAVDLPS